MAKPGQKPCLQTDQSEVQICASKIIFKLTRVTTRMNLLTTTSSSPLLLLLLFFLFTIQGQKEDVAVAPGPSGEKGAGQSLCETSSKFFNFL